MEYLDTLLISRLGLVKPWQRVLFVGGATWAVQSMIKPFYAYQDGIQRPFIMTYDPEDDSGVEPTIVPWWGLPALAGSLAGLII